MKIRFLKSITVDVEKTKLNETWDKSFNRWDVIQVDEVFISGKMATLKTYEGDWLLGVPSDSFEQIKEEKKLVVI